MWPYFLRLPNGRVTHIALTDPSFDTLHHEQWSLTSLFERRLTDGLTLRSNLRYAQGRFLGRFVDALSLSPDQRTLNRYAGEFTDQARSLTADTQLEGRFTTGFVQHVGLVGVDYAEGFSGLRFGQALAPSLSLVNPVYRQGVVGPLAYVLNSGTRTEQTGVYAQDQIKIDRLVVTAGARYDWTDQRARDRLRGGVTGDQSASQSSGRIGAVYLLPGGFAPYASYSTSFNPVTGARFGGGTFDPSTGEQVEAGVKYQPPSLDASATLSVFQIDQDNVLTPDPLHTGFQIQTGRVRSSGAEANAVANLGLGLSLTANYSYTDTRVTRSNGADFRKRLIGVPRNQASVWGDYVRPDGPLKGLGGGLGVRYVDDTAQDAANTGRNPDSTAFDLALHYDWSRYRVSLNVDNLGDLRKAVCISGNCTFSQGRTVIGALRYRG